MVGYERLGHLVAVSALKPPDCPDELKVKIETERLCIGFVDYVKSQVHLNLTDDLYGRPLCEYVKAMRFFSRKDDSYRENALKVLRFFYHDLALFLINYELDLQMDVVVPESLDLPTECYSVAEVQDSLLSAINNPTATVMKNFKFSQLLKLVDTKSDIITKKSSSAVAAILLRESNSSQLHRIKLEV